MAKTKRGEKLGEIVGKRHPIVAVILIFLGLTFALAMLDFTPGQNIFFKEYFEPFMVSTESSGNNLIGKIGSTFCTISFLVLGAGSIMIPIYMLWVGAMCFYRSATAVSKGTIIATFSGVLLLSILSAIIQTAVNAPMQTGVFPSGWGGKFGQFIFSTLLFPFLNLAGSALLIAPLYFFCLVVVFVDSPIEAVKELKGAAKKSPSLMLATLKVCWSIIAWLPKLLWNMSSKKKSEDEDLEEAFATKKRVGTPKPRASQKEKLNAIKKGEVANATIETPADTELDIELQEEVSVETEVETQDLPEEEPTKVIDLTNVQVQTPLETSPIVDFGDRFDDGDETPRVIDLTSVKSPKKQSKATKDDKASSTIQVTKTVVETLPEVPLAPEKRGDYIFPSLELLQEPTKPEDIVEEDYNSRITEIVNVIGTFGVKVTPDQAFPGPVITRYEVKPAPGVKISRIANLEDDITAGIKAQKVRIIAPVPGRGTVGIEVPNIHRQNVTMREVLQSKQWRENKYALPIALGKDATGTPIVADMKKMVHALIAGSTGSGKSVCINTIIVSMLYKMTPEDLRLIMIDPKMVELQGYNTIPHMLIPVVCDVKKAAAALKWLVSEMMRRYEIFKKTGVRNIDGFNAKILKDKEQMKQAEADFAEMSSEERQAMAMASDELNEDTDVDIPKQKLPYIVCIIDELADLMSVVGKEVETYIARITQLARAAGIHMIVATQRPDVKVITGLIKNNLPTRIAFKVKSQIDSRTILDHKGAETLIGWGDMLFHNNGAPDPVRAQGAFLDDDEIESIIEALKVNGEPEYAEDVQAQIDASDEDEDDVGESGGKFKDPMTAKAIGIIKANGKASTSLLQRKLSVGYGRAAKIIDELEDMGYIGPDKGQGQRDIFID